MSLLEYLDVLGQWFLSNLDKLVFSIFTLVVVYIAYRVSVREIRSLAERKKLQDHLAYTLTRITKWASIAVVLLAILAQWGVTLGVIAGVLAIFGGTIIGFAAVNTLGNALAGLIVMTSKPFEVGDRIFFNNQFADVVTIDVIYTKMRTLDNVLVSVPNQELLKSEIDNYGKKKVVRRHCTVTPGFEYDSEDVQEALLEAAGNVKGVLTEPKPYVWITQFQNYAVEYNLYVFINDIKRLPEIDADLHREVLRTCKAHKIDITTPLLLKQLKQ
ncbi:MAG: mechanosensitive ion channel [Candidatus Bathyarchaeota archaeon]|nr:MAG: mechanosensitive ion channel [Candidatus Bathyarchaeota archaeon]